jgi:hypothetical protein
MLPKASVGTVACVLDTRYVTPHPRAAYLLVLQVHAGVANIRCHRHLTQAAIRPVRVVRAIAANISCRGRSAPHPATSSITRICSRLKPNRGTRRNIGSCAQRLSAHHLPLSSRLRSCRERCARLRRARAGQRDALRLRNAAEGVSRHSRVRFGYSTSANSQSRCVREILARFRATPCRRD